MADPPHVTFLAAFPNIQCIKYCGDGGARIVLDIPASDEGVVESLRQWRDRVLMVTVVPVAKGVREAESDDGHGEPVGRRAAKRRVVQGDTSL
jgi:hypothetical protein